MMQPENGVSMVFFFPPGVMAIFIFSLPSLGLGYSMFPINDIVVPEIFRIFFTGAFTPQSLLLTI